MKPLSAAEMAKALERISGLASNRGRTGRDEEYLGRIEAIARDALGQNHGVWRWRVGWEQWLPPIH